MRHVWKGQQVGGDPADAGSTEWVAYCDNCGVEADDDNEDGECVPVEDDESIVAPILPPYEGWRMPKPRAEVRAETTIVRKYYVTWGQLKDWLDLKGELYSSDLWSGLSPKEAEEGKSRDGEVIEIITHEKQER